MRGMIFDIQRFSLNNGPGLRTTAFLKGCPLHCAWCHNPESLSRAPLVLFNEKLCTACGRCVSACASGLHRIENGRHLFLHADCRACGKCVTACLSGALERKGEEVDAASVVAEAIRDRAFYERAGGGITLSGGEPLVQIDFCRELLTLSKAEGLHTCLDTSGYAPREDILSLVPLTDIFLLDIKETDEQRHIQYTGVSNRLILDNLVALNEAQASIHLRCPIIPGLNDRDGHLEQIAALSRKYARIAEIFVIPYHHFGTSKLARMGIHPQQEEIPLPTKEAVRAWVSKIAQNTDIPVTAL